jgi:nickel-dependent lactate racemase
VVGAGVEPDGVTVLRTEADARAQLADPRPWLAKDVSDEIALVVHEPASRGDMAYLASSEGGDPILLNRALTDADVVLPIGGFRSRSSAGYFGIHSAIFPTFSDQRTLQRYRSPTSHDARGRPKRKAGQLADEVGWLLGVTLTVQVVPGPGDRVLHVVAGQTESVRRRATALYEAAWRCSVPRRASLVVAAIEGSPPRQTWESVGRALAVAGGLVEDGGAIAVCCDLADAPGPAVRQLAAAPVRDEALRWIRRERPADALPATLLAQALDRATIYLLSRLDPSLLEDLEVAPVAKAEELVRLAGRHASCILLADAPHALIRLEKEA